MIKEPLPIIANRYADTIKSEIAVFNKQLPDLVKTGFGFRFHNFACPCEMLVKYWGGGLKEIGFPHLVSQIEFMGRWARGLQEKVDSGTFWEDTDNSRSVLEFQDYVNKMVPSLFFLV